MELRAVGANDTEAAAAAAVEPGVDVHNTPIETALTGGPPRVLSLPLLARANSPSAKAAASRPTRTRRAAAAAVAMAGWFSLSLCAWVPSAAPAAAGARCTRVEDLARQRLSLSQRDAAEHNHPSPWSGRRMFRCGTGRRVCHSLRRNLARRPARLSYSNPGASRSIPA